MGLFGKVFNGIFGNGSESRSQEDIDFEKQVRNDGYEYAGKRIADLLNEKITSKDLAKQFVLEELDAARQGNDYAKNFVKNSGFKSVEYVGAMNKTRWVGDESELEHLQLFLRAFLIKISDIDLMVKVSTAVVDEIMKRWGLGKYENNILNGGMRLKEAEVDIMFIIKNNQVLYLNDDSDHLFILDKDGDEKLDGRIVIISYMAKYSNDIIEFFVAFDDQDSYTMFTLQANLDIRLNYVARAIYEYFFNNNISYIFNYNGKEEYSTQFEYTFKLYKKEEQYFMVNNGQTKAFIVDKNNIKRSDDSSVDNLKQIFW